MEKENLILFMKLVIKILVIFIIIILGIILLKNSPPVLDKKQIKTASLIDYPSKYNYQQTANDCGPYNTAAVVRALKKEGIDSQTFAEEIEWRLPNKYTLPWGLEKQLKDNGIVIEIPNLKSLSEHEKILFLQQQLSQNKPVIILGEINNFEHYMTVFGFDSANDEFYVYDSLEKAEYDVNGDLPGNRMFTSKELLDFWRDGGMFGIYRWYAIVSSVNSL